MRILLPAILLLAACGSEAHQSVPDVPGADAAPDTPVDTVAVADTPARDAALEAAGPDVADAVAVADVIDSAPAPDASDVGAEASTDATADAAACGAGRADCDGDPSNGCEATLATDPNNCGTCRTACGFGAFCRDSRCVCLAGRDRCGATCVELSGDNNNCGTCGHRCTSREVCVNGMCVTR